ncbi:MAG: DEAD/DEAH box helicase [Promethearchaeota archaeon]
MKWYDRRRGYGFVTPDAGHDDVFLHRSELPEDASRRIREGSRVSFSVERKPRGAAAVDVACVGGEQEWAGAGETIGSEGDARGTDSAASAGFEGLGLIRPLLRAVKDQGYEEPTPIQLQGIPHVLSGRDFLGCAQTGTGKTAAFALPIIQRFVTQPTGDAGAPGRGSGTRAGQRQRQGMPGKRPVRALVLAPTRELAIQINDNFTAYSRHTSLRSTVVYGGVGQNPQVEALRRGVDLLVATPGRLLDLMGQGHVDLARVEVLVFDEADRMLDMGFIHDVRRIVRAVPKRGRQTLLFSATLPPEITKLAGDILSDPVRVSVSPERPTVEAIEQAVYFVEGRAAKQKLLEHLLRDPGVRRALVFTRTKHGANRVVKLLKRGGVDAEAIHGNKSQTARQRALKNFREGVTRVLVATDVAARGIDVEEISHVIQFTLPNVPEMYVHRVGRTGRAGSRGIALSFCSADERQLLKDVEKFIKMRVPVISDHPYRRVVVSHPAASRQSRRKTSPANRFNRR